MINLIFRKKTPDFNSIEEIFSSVHMALQQEIDIRKLEVPEKGADLKSLIHNLLYISKKKGKINHVTGHVNYLALVAGKKTILTIHDVDSYFNENLLQKLFIKIFWFWFPALLVKRITVISAFSLNELLEVIPFAKKKIRVIHNPVNQSLNYVEKVFDKKKPLILHLGTKPNKNLERTIQALKGINCRLLIIGALTAQQLELLKQYKLDFDNRKFIPFSEIKTAYEECDIVSFVSLYEGFGMPVIEAQAVGRPVLSSIKSSIPEVAGTGALLVDPTDVLAIRKGFLKIIEDDAFREDLIIKGQENVKRFKIKTIAAQYKNLYREVANV